MVTRARSLIFEISETGRKGESKNKNIRKTVTGAQVFIADCINATKKIAVKNKIRRSVRKRQIAFNSKKVPECENGVNFLPLCGSVRLKGFTAFDILCPRNYN